MGRDALQTDDAISTAQKNEHAIVCRACGHTLTFERFRIDVAGRHQHTFVNPSAIVFTIACFAEAQGCAAFGERETFFTWFPGHAWQIVLCGSCAAHVGWSFAGDSFFFALIVDRVA